MNVKDLLVNSWNNMLKNGFIAKVILVTIALCLVSVVFSVVSAILFSIWTPLGVIAAIALIIFMFPIQTSATKVLLDAFNGREAKVFGFVGYGIKNCKRIWGILFHTILKMLIPFLVIVVLIVVSVVWSYKVIVSAINNITTEGLKNNLSSSTELIEDMNDLESTLSTDLDSSLDDINSALEKYNSEVNTTTTPNSLDINSLEDIPEEVIEAGKLLLKEFAKYTGVMIIYTIVLTAAFVWFYTKKLLYAYNYVCFFDDDNLTALNAVEKSEELMMGHRLLYVGMLIIIYLILSVVQAIVLKLGTSAPILILYIVISIVGSIYSHSFTFTFFNELRGGNSSDKPVVEETPEAPAE